MNENRPDEFSFHSALKEKELWCLIAVCLIYFRKPLFFGESLYYRDLILHFLPQKKLTADLILNGQWPAWDPFLHGGQPLLADSNHVVLYPFNILYLFLSPLTAFNWDIALNFIFCAAFPYLLTRAVGFDRKGAVVAGLVYAFGGYSLSLPNIWLYSPAYVPLILLFWHLFLMQGRKRWFVLCVIAGALQILSGRPELPPVTFLLQILWTIVYPFPERRRVPMLLQFCLMALLTVCLAAVQLVPMTEMLLLSTRPQSTPLLNNSIHPGRLPELIIPGFLGKTPTLNMFHDYWGMHLEDTNPPQILSIYWGLPALLLTCFGGCAGGNQPLARKVRAMLLILFLLSILCSLGRFLPGSEFLKKISVLSLFRYPVKCLTLAMLPAALLSAAGLHTIETDSRHRKYILVLLALISGFVFLLIPAGIRYWSSFSAHFEQFFFKASGDFISEGMLQAFLYGLAINLLALALLFWSMRGRAAITLWCFVALIGLDLLISGAHINPSVPRALITKNPEIVQLVQREIGDGRLYQLENMQRILQAPTNDIFWEYRWNFVVLNSYTAAFYRIPIVFHNDFDQMATRSMVDISRVLEVLPWERRQSILSAAGVTLILTSDEIPGSWVQKVADIPNNSNLVFHLYRNMHAMPRAQVVYDELVVPSPEKTIHLLMDPQFDPRKSVIVTSSLAGHNSENCAPGSVRNLDRNATHSTLYAEASCDGYLVFAEPYYPGWKVEVDGKPAQVVRANYTFSAVQLPKGHHLIIRNYAPVTLKLGFAITLAALLCVLILPNMGLQTTRRLMRN